VTYRHYAFATIFGRAGKLIATQFSHPNAHQKHQSGVRVPDPFGSHFDSGEFTYSAIYRNGAAIFLVRLM
jgi:hypothetical protein